MARLAVGYVARAHGIRGEVRVQLHAPDSTALYDAKTLLVGGKAYPVDSVRPTAGALLVKLDGINDKNAADALAGQAIEVDRSELPLAEGEFFLADLPGCDCFTVDGVALGRVFRIMHGPQDILVLHDTVAGVERLVPFVGEFVVEVDIAAKRVVLDLPDGLPTEPLQTPRDGK